jgi:hypothetical protein
VVRNFSKYNYSELTRDESTGRRLYKTPEGNLVPSVTTILSKTKDTSGLDNWRRRMGDKEADRIVREACSVGTSMHHYLEDYILEEKREYDMSPVHSQAHPMGEQIIKKGLCHVDEIWGSEVQLYFEDKYAGTTDVIGLYKGIPYIIYMTQTFFNNLFTHRMGLRMNW